MSKILDTNLLIRYFLNDDRQKSEAVEKLLSSKEKLILTDVAMSEIVWVLSSYYKVSKDKISEWLLSLLTLPTIKANKTLLTKAINFFGQFPVDWIDAYLAAYAVEKKVGKICSYDIDFDKVGVVKREEP